MNPARNKQTGKSVKSQRKSTAMDRPGRNERPKLHSNEAMKAARDKRDVNKKMSNGRKQHSSRTHLP